MKDSKGRKLKAGESQMKDGRYRYRYQDALGNRKAIYAWRLLPSDKMPPGKKAKPSLREMEYEVQKDVYDQVIDTNMSVSSYVNKYLETKISIALNTKTLYNCLWRNHINGSYLGRMKVSDVKKFDVIRFYTELYTKKKLSRSTINTVHIILSAAFKLAVEDSFLRFNPCTGCMKEIQKNNVQQRLSLSHEEQEVLVSFVKNDKHYSRYYPMIAMFLGTGIRVSELAGLTWDDVDLENGILIVDHQVIYEKTDNGYQFLWTATKNRTKRNIPLQKNLLDVLIKYRDFYVSHEMYSKLELNGHVDFVFLCRMKKPFMNTSIEYIFRNIVRECNAAEIERSANNKKDFVLLGQVTPHVLRHTYCTRMAEAGIDMKVLQNLMGHKTLEMTMQVYNHASIQRIKESVNNVREIKL